MSKPPAAPALDLGLGSNQVMLAQMAAEQQNPLAMGPMPAPVDSNLTRGLAGVPLAGGMLAEWSRNPQAYVEQNYKPDEMGAILQQSDAEYHKATGQDPKTKTGSYTFEF